MLSTGFVSSGVGELYFERRAESEGIPLVAVHGGPGFSSHYLEPLFELSAELPVVLYDQAGCGRARQRGDRRSFTIDGFVEELEALRLSLGVSRMHLMGHSFGGVVIGEYALKFPQCVASALFVSASLDIPRWISDGERLLSALPMMPKMILREGIRTGNYFSAEFQAALGLYYKKYVYGFDEKPEILTRSEEQSDGLTYRAVWGPNELVVDGIVRNYSLSPRLSEISCPAIFMCGRYDEATPEAHEFFASCVSGARLKVFEQSAHHPHLSEQEDFLRETREFLLRV